jgi:hypothetical protein
MDRKWYVSSEEDVQQQVMGYTRYREIIEAIKAQFPKRRRNSVICPITGQETDLRYGLSRRAWELILKGLELEKREESKDTEVYAASYFWNRVEIPRPDGYTDFEDIKLMNLVGELLNQRTGRREFFSDNVKTLHDIERRDAPLLTLELNERQANAVREFGKRLNELMQKISQKSFQIGSSWVQNLATGRLTLEQVNEWHTDKESKH